MDATSGCEYNPQQEAFNLVSLGQPLSVSYPQGEVLFQGTGFCPFWEWRLLSLNYLWRSDGTPLAGELVSFRQLKHGHVFYPAFVNMGIAQLATSLAGSAVNTDQVREACLTLGGRLERGAEIQATFPLLPRFPVTVQIWPGDEEMAGNANILFDASATNYLHIEDVVVAGNLVARFLVQHYEMLTT
ncbi:MAG: DUF3786 domain-containing protein [Thermacetogeniaceae bacterium]